MSNLKVLFQVIERLFSNRDNALFESFPMKDFYLTVFNINVIDIQLGKFRESHPCGVKKFHDGPVPYHDYNTFSFVVGHGCGEEKFYFILSE